MPLYAWPAGRLEDHNADPASHQVLLILQILIRREQQIVTTLLDSSDELTILQRAPAKLVCCGDLMIDQSALQRNWDTLIKDDLQAATLLAAYSKTASTCSRVTPGNQPR